MSTYTIYNPNTNEIVTDKTYKTARAAEIQASRMKKKNTVNQYMSIITEESYFERNGCHRDWLKPYKGK